MPERCGEPTGVAYFPPSVPLRSWLSMHAVVRAAGGEIRSGVPALLPNLHVVVSGVLVYGFGDREVVAPPVTLLGPTTRSFTMRTPIDTVIVAVGLLPWGWAAAVGLPAVEIVDQAVDATTTWPTAEVTRLLDALTTGPLDGTHVGRVEEFVTRLRPVVSTDGRHVACVDHWLESRGGDFSLDRLRADLGLSARQVARVTLAAHGSPPGELARKYRALRAASLLVARGSEAMPAALTGYADQSHLIRDLKHVVGCTPGVLRGDGRQLAAATLGGRRRAGASRPLSLWS